MQLGPDAAAYVPLRVPVIEPVAATVAVPVVTSATPPPVVMSENEKFEKVIIWAEIVPLTVGGTTWANSCTLNAAPVRETFVTYLSTRVSDGRFAEQVDDAVIVKS